MFSNKKAAMQKHFYSCMAVLCLFRLKTPLKVCFLQSLSEVLFPGPSFFCGIPIPEAVSAPSLRRGQSHFLMK